MENLPVKYGTLKPEIIRELAVSSFGYVLNDIDRLRNNFVSLAFHLYEIKKYEYYKDFGYDDFYKFCERNFSLKKSSVCNYISVLEKFGVRNGLCLCNRLEKRFEEYSFTQLVELHSVPLNEIENYPPSMSVNEIKAWKRVEKLCSVPDEESVVQSTGQNKFLCVTDFLNLKGVCLQRKIAAAESRSQRRVVIYDEKGKQLHSFDCDVLLMDNALIRLRIIKEKD